MSLGQGFGVRFRGVVGGGFPVENEEKGKGVRRVGSGVGTGKGTGQSMRKLCRRESPVYTCYRLSCVRSMPRREEETTIGLLLTFYKLFFP